MKKLNVVSDYWLNELRDSSDCIPGEETFLWKLLDISNSCSKILEIGVGRGRMVRILRKCGVSANIFGIDINKNVSKAEVTGVIGDARRLPFFDDTFDLVYSLGVVEHFPETGIAVAEHSRVVKKHGYVLVTTPHLAILTPFRYLVYLLKDSRYGSFEETKGRNIMLGTMARHFREANLCIKGHGFYGIWGLDYYLRKSAFGNTALKLQRFAFIGSYMYMLGQKV